MLTNKFQRRILKVAEPDLTLGGASRVTKFVSTCICSAETKLAREAYTASANKLELVRAEYKSLLANGSTAASELDSLKLELIKLTKAVDGMRRAIPDNGCKCWAATSYSIWEEEGTLFQDQDDPLGLPYHIYKGTKFYLDEEGYFVFDVENDGRVLRFPLGFGQYYRSPDFEQLHPCSWHGNLTRFQKNEIAARMPAEGERVVMQYANPVTYQELPANREDYKGEVYQYKLPTGEMKEVMVVNSEGPCPTYGVYVYTRYGGKIDITCYDNCYAQTVEAVVSEISFNEDKVRRLRSFVNHVAAVHESVKGNFATLNKFLERIQTNTARLKEVKSQLYAITSNNRRNEVEAAREALTRAEENLVHAREEAEANWLRRVLKVKNAKLLLEESQAALNGGSLKSFEELLTMDQPAEDAPEPLIRLFNAVIDYENYDLDVEEGLYAEKPDVRAKLKADVMDLQVKMVLGALPEPSYDFEAILEREPPAETDSPLEKELFLLVEEYKRRVREEEKGTETLKEKILVLYAEIEEELEEDRKLEESLRNTLLDVPTEMDTSKEAQIRYVDTACSAMKVAVTRATSALRVKENILRREEQQLPELNKEQEDLTISITQDNTNMYRSIKAAHFPGRWFLEQGSEFLNLRPGERFSLEEETETGPLTPEQERFRRETQNKEFDAIKNRITERCNNVTNLLKETTAYLNNYKSLWPEAKVLSDYETYVREQKEFSMTRHEREELKVAAAALEVAKGVVVQTAGVMAQPESDDEEEEEKKEEIKIVRLMSPVLTKMNRADFKPANTLTWTKRFDDAQRAAKVASIKGPEAGLVVIKTSSPVVRLPPFIKLNAPASVEAAAVETVIAEPASEGVFTPVRVRANTPVVASNEVPAMPVDEGTGRVYTPARVRGPAGTVTLQHVPPPSPKAKSPVVVHKPVLKLVVPSKAKAERDLTDFPALPPIKPVAKAVRKVATPVKVEAPVVETPVVEAPVVEKEEVVPSKPRLVFRKMAPLAKPPPDKPKTPVVTETVTPAPVEVVPEKPSSPPKIKPVLRSAPKSSVRARPSNVFASLAEITANEG